MRRLLQIDNDFLAGFKVKCPLFALSFVVFDFLQQQPRYNRKNPCCLFPGMGCFSNSTPTQQLVQVVLLGRPPLHGLFTRPSVAIVSF
jgi:hypothetical protein